MPLPCTLCGSYQKMPPKRKATTKKPKPSDNNNNTSSKAATKKTPVTKKSPVKAKSTKASEKRPLRKPKKEKVRIYDNGVFLQLQILNYRVIVAMPVLKLIPMLVLM